MKKFALLLLLLLSFLPALLYLTVQGARAGTEELWYEGRIIGLGDRFDFLWLNRGNQAAATYCIAQGLQVKERIEFLLLPEVDITILTEFGELKLRKGSIVYIVDGGKSLAVFDLHDAHSNDVTLKTRNHVAALAAGQVLTVAKSDTFPGWMERIPMRTMQISNNQTLGETTWLADFSVPAVLPQIKHLCSSNQTTDKLARVLKTQAALSIITSKRGNFTPAEKLLARN
jgi:hypothetical protein